MGSRGRSLVRIVETFTGRKPSATLAINERVTEMRSRGERVYHLGFGESRFPVHPRLAEALAAHATRKSYLPALGLPALRESVARFYRHDFGMDIEPAQVIIGPGSKMLLYALLRVLEGDLILPAPAWVSYAPQADLVGKPVHWIETWLQDEYRLTPDALKWTIDRARQAGGNPRLLLLNSPSNPTGTMYPENQIAALSEVAAREGLIVLSDEVYALVTHGDVAHVSMARYYPQGTVVTAGLSKHLSLGGWRLGLAIVPPTPEGRQLMAALQVIASETWSAVSAPIQHAAAVAYSGDPEIMDYVHLCAGIHGAIARHLYRALRDTGIGCARPVGAFYLYPNFDAWREGLARRGVHTSEDLARYLLEVQSIVTLPGTDFGSRPESLSLRLATSYLDAETDADAEALLDAYRTAPDEQTFIRTACPNLLEVEARFQTLGQEMAPVSV